MVVCSIIRKTVSQKQYCNKGVTRNRTLSSRKGEISLAFAIFLLILLIFLCLWGWLHHRAISPPPPSHTSRADNKDSFFLFYSSNALCYISSVSSNDICAKVFDSM